MHHRVAFGFEFGAGLPLGKLIRFGNLVADLQEQLQILHGAGKIPVGLYLVGDLVIVVGGVFLLASAGRSPSGLPMISMPCLGSSAGTPCLANSKWSER